MCASVDDVLVWDRIGCLHSSRSPSWYTTTQGWVRTDLINKSARVPSIPIDSINKDYQSAMFDTIALWCCFLCLLTAPKENTRQTNDLRHQYHNRIAEKQNAGGQRAITYSHCALSTLFLLFNTPMGSGDGICGV